MLATTLQLVERAFDIVEEISGWATGPATVWSKLGLVRCAPRGAKMAVILCYGDSNTHGTKPLASQEEPGRYQITDRWPNVMAELLGAEHQVIAEGLPGRTTVHDDPVDGGGRSGIAVLPAILHSHKPIDLIIMMLGTNDLKPRFSVSAFEIAKSLERLVLMTKAENVVSDILLVAPVPVLDNGSLSEVLAGAEARQQGLSGWIADVASRTGCGFFDAGTEIGVSAQDGVHFEAAGHHKLGAAMARAVVDQLS